MYFRSIIRQQEKYLWRLHEMQLNFLNYFSLSKNGVRKQVEEVLEILEVAISLIPKYPSFRRVVSTQIRLLICDKENSLINKIFEEPRLPAFTNEYFGGNSSDELTFHKIYPMFDYEKSPINLEDWLSKKIIYFNRDYKEIPSKIEETMYQQIVCKIKPKSNRQIFERHYIKTKGYIEEQEYTMRELKYDISETDKMEIHEILEKSGYNSLTVYDFIKMWGDKSASHVDCEQPTGMMLFKPRSDDIHYLDSIAIMLIGVLRNYLNENPTD